MKVIFLDYDGVVNTLWFQDINGEPNFNFPTDNKVNNIQAIAWLNKLCRETEAKIVVTSTWRMFDNYKECLYNAGLDKNIEILGRTAVLNIARGLEIQEWLDNNEDKNIENFVILDDDMDMEHLTDHSVFTDENLGLTFYTYYQAKQILEKGVQ